MIDTEPRQWTPAEVRSLERLAPTHTAAEIADRLGRTANAVHQQAYLRKIRLQKSGDRDYRTKYSDALVEQCRALHDAGVQPKEISERTGVPLASVKAFVYYLQRADASLSLLAADDQLPPLNVDVEAPVAPDGGAR